jgi:hypothetical protein
MAQIAVSPINAQLTPARFFVMDPIKSIDAYMQIRDAALGLVIGKIQEKGSLPANYDVRPITPVDDFGLFTGTSPYNGYAMDWSISTGASSGQIGGTIYTSLSGAGNTIVYGTMPSDRYTAFYGTEIQTPGTPAEVYWKFTSGANIKSIWFLQDLLGFDYPRASTRQVPVWGSQEPCTHVLYTAAQQTVVDAHLTLWAEPVGTTITASNLRA